jgi:hypothetical protein
MLAKTVLKTVLVLNVLIGNCTAKTSTQAENAGEKKTAIARGFRQAVKRL